MSINSFDRIIPCIAAGHLTQATYDALRRSETKSTVGAYEDGLFLTVPGLDLRDCDALPRDLHALYSWAQERGYRWVQLDRDADDIDGLPYHGHD